VGFAFSLKMFAGVFSFFAWILPIYIYIFMCVVSCVFVLYMPYISYPC